MEEGSVRDGGSFISRDGSEKRVWSVAAWREVGVGVLGLERLRGRWERGSIEVGMDSGIGSDILGVGDFVGWWRSCMDDGVRYSEAQTCVWLI